MSTASEPSLQSGSENRSATQSLNEEHAADPENPEPQAEEEEESGKEEGFCSFFDLPHVPRATLEEYHHDQLRENHLFANVLTLEMDEEEVCVERSSEDPDTSFLVTGFGMRTLTSLQDALKVKERNRLLELFKSQKAAAAEEEIVPQTTTTPTKVAPKPTSSKRSIETETELSTATSDVSVQQDKVRYLMGLEAEAWEGETYPQEEDLVKHMFAKESEDKFVFAETATMKSAQLYLRTHRIFDFFQFIIAHILSEAPDNPINFILVLLNKILLYRAGTGSPPLLYERKHIAQLFKLMDRINSGFIDKEQYKSGMISLGICAYNKDPPLSEEGLVAREVFIREALEAETALFNDLIKRKWTGDKQKLDDSYSGLTTTHPVMSYTSGLNLIPSDFLKSKKPEKVIEEAEEG